MEHDGKQHQLRRLALVAFIGVVLLLGSEQAAAGSGSYCESLIESNGYPCEAHYVTTKDGYILSMQRIPSGSSSSDAGQSNTPVLVQHGLVADGATWLVSSMKESLGFVLADAGFDVWIVNGRGTKYSMGHTSLSPTDPAYWDFSWDELAAYDLPACIDYVYGKTGNQMHYVGHSQGTLMVLAALSQGGGAVGNLRSAALLSPIAYMDHVTSLLTKAMADAFLANIVRWLGIYEFDPSIPAVQDFLSKVCSLPNIDCTNMIAALTGDNCCVDQSTFDTFNEYEPQPTPTKNMIHLAQMIRTGEIAKYDYGSAEENTAHYGQATPPSYDMTAIAGDFPLYLAYGGMDDLSDTTDVEHLMSVMQQNQQGGGDMQSQLVKNYAHMDFVLADNAAQVVYGPIISFFNNH